MGQFIFDDPDTNLPMKPGARMLVEPGNMEEIDDRCPVDAREAGGWQ